VIGLLAFLFEFIPMLGPVLGMIPAVIIALFQQPFPLTLWVIVYFIILQQVESNFIVPRVSGHAVGLHPLAALMSLIIGLDLGGIGGALLSVPLAGVAWVMMMALYSDTTGQSSMLVQTQRRTAVKSIRNIIGRRRSQPGTAAAADIDTSAPVPVHNERIAAIKHEQEQLIEQFEADQVGQAVAEHNSLSEAPQEEQARHSPETRGPDDVQAPSVTH